MNTLAGRLSHLMEMAGVSIKQLQEIAEVTYEMARRYKLGTAIPRDDKLEKIADYFATTPAYLKYGKIEPLDVVLHNDYKSLNLAKRTSQQMTYKGINLEQLSEKSKLPQETIMNVLNSTINASSNPYIVDAIAKALGVSSESLLDDEYISIVVLDIEASAGNGAINGDVVQVIKELRFVPEEYHRRFPGINENTTRIINVKGDSMNPTFQHGDLLFVDISISTFDGDGIYVFTFDNNLFVKRVQKTGRDFCIISDNEALYKPWLITPKDMPEMYIHGKVKVHQSQKLNFIG